MKNLLLIFALVVSTNLVKGQCKSDECVSKLSDGYTFLKTYKMETVGDQTEYSYVFSKDTNYILVLCNKEGSADNISVTLLDANKKEIATSYDKKNNKFFSAIAYTCKATGIYYLRFTYKEKPECCVSVLAFKK